MKPVSNASAATAVRQASALQADELEYVDDISNAMLLKTPKYSQWLLYIIALLVCASLLWAALSKIDQVTRGDGRVIPSQQIQVIQNLEGGILDEIFIAAGDLVSKGQPLIRIDDTRFLSDFREQEQEQMFLKARLARHQAELQSIRIQPGFYAANNWKKGVQIEPKEIEFGSTRADDSGALKALRLRERTRLSQRLQTVSNRLSIIDRQINQRLHEKKELSSNIEHLETGYRLGQEEYNLTKPLADQGVVSRVELLQLERQLNQVEQELESSRLQLPKVEAAFLEAIDKRREAAFKHRAETQEKLGEVQAKLARLSETRVNLRDRVDRTTVLSPVQGTVKRIAVNTVGGVIQPGMDLVEIVPTEDHLSVEAKILPKDIAFLRPGLEAVVRFTAYDFAIYGGLKGKVEHISADSIEDEKGDLYYLVRVRTDQTGLGATGTQLPIIPGMTATIDIVTGQKSVLDYLLKPILRAKQRALTER
ncbi:MAG: HlyD family type I secretion periplasmic adaptor subunit [Motiliproteus sp.]